MPLSSPDGRVEMSRAGRWLKGNAVRSCVDVYMTLQNVSTGARDPEAMPHYSSTSDALPITGRRSLDTNNRAFVITVNIA